jgi:hypothetical protein
MWSARGCGRRDGGIAELACGHGRRYAVRRLLTARQLATFQSMHFPLPDVSDVVAELQVQRYRAMSPTEKLEQADALFDLTWAAVKAGVRMRHPDLDDTAVHLAARALFRCAVN